MLYTASRADYPYARDCDVPSYSVTSYYKQTVKSFQFSYGYIIYLEVIHFDSFSPLIVEIENMFSRGTLVLAKEVKLPPPPKYPKTACYVDLNICMTGKEGGRRVTFFILQKNYPIPKIGVLQKIVTLETKFSFPPPPLPPCPHV